MLYSTGAVRESPFLIKKINAIKVKSHLLFYYNLGKKCPVRGNIFVLLRLHILFKYPVRDNIFIKLMYSRVG